MDNGEEEDTNEDKAEGITSSETGAEIEAETVPELSAEPTGEVIETPVTTPTGIAGRGYRKSVLRVPPEDDGIQVNFCKNPLCGNYGVPAMDSRPTKATTGMPGAAYTVTGGSTGAGMSGIPSLLCKICGEYPTIKSNRGIAEEVRRLGNYLYVPEPYCPNEECTNYEVSLSAGTDRYYRIGLTKAGSSRYKCRACGKTFSKGKPSSRQKEPHKNREVFVALMNKAPLRRACEMAQINVSTIYDKIDFIYRQCMAFVGARERKLTEGKALPKMYIAVDRQDYTVNWTEREDKRNVVLHAVGSADLTTGYVFGMHLNFDPLLDRTEIEADADSIGDARLPYPYRKYSRLWLASDYAESVIRSAKRPSKRKGKLTEEIESEYADAVSRADVEASENKTHEVKLPSKGMQVHAEYTLYAHFFHLRKLLAGAEKYRFFLDQDSGMRAACLAAFQPEIKARIADAFFVRILKDCSVGEKQSAVNAAKKVFDEFCARYPHLSEDEVRAILMKEEIARCKPFGKWSDKWAKHPLPNKSEPEKAVCYLTDFDDYDEDHKANLYLKASLHAIDRYFQSTRRRISMVERPIASASRFGLKWNGYAAYKPENVAKLLAIHRVYYNYCLAGEDKKTPAMRLGLAKAVIDPLRVLYFQ